MSAMSRAEKMAYKKNHIREPIEDRIFNVIIHIILFAIILVVLYPLYFVLVASFSDPIYVNSGDLLLYPKGFTTIGYGKVFEDERIWIGYGNTLIYTVCGTLLGTFCTILAGYALSRRDLPGRGIVMGMMVFTMYFGGGLVPLYMVVKGLHLTDSRWIIILLGSVSVYNIIIARSFFVSNMPQELQDAAFIDGCGNARYFFSIVVPLSQAIIAVIALYLAVGQWNSYFNAMIFLTDKAKYPLQIFLREILVVMSQVTEGMLGSDAESAAEIERMMEVIKYGVIIVSTLPIICVYPFLQKYFVKGVMIGAIKG